MFRNVALIAMGSNLAPDGLGPSDELDKAVSLIESPEIRVESVSSYYSTPAYPAGAGPDFVNAALAVESDLSPTALLARLHAAEAALGRERTMRWGPRVIDLDLLAVGDRVLPDLATWRRWADLDPAQQGVRAPDRLILPHPRLQDRAFVLVPLAEIAPDWIHPVLGATAVALRDSLPQAERTAIRRL